MKKLFLFIFLSLIFCNVGFSYTIKGSVSCGTIISSYDSEPALTNGMMTAFINGYFTGRNYEIDGDVGSGIDNDSMFFALLKYCRENPLKKNYHAAEHIFQKLK